MKLSKLHNFSLLFEGGGTTDIQAYFELFNFSEKKSATELFDIINKKTFSKKVNWKGPLGKIKWITKFCNCRRILDIYGQWLLTAEWQVSLLLAFDSTVFTKACKNDFLCRISRHSVPFCASLLYSLSASYLKKTTSPICHYFNFKANRTNCFPFNVIGYDYSNFPNYCRSYHAWCKSDFEIII